jgi:hypothetical protein
MPVWRNFKHGTGCWVDIGNGLVASVGYEASERLSFDAPHYNVTVLGTRLPGRSASIDEAKTRAESAMRTALQSALNKLESE